MTDAMVTGRMTAEKKARGNEILAKAGLNASQAINVLYDHLLEEKSADFLIKKNDCSKKDWALAAAFVDELSSPIKTKFDNMSVKDAKQARLKAKGLM